MDKNYIETVQLLLDVAPFVFEENHFAMKGGTAINLFCRNMPRLSVDIDLVFIGPEAEKREIALLAIEGALNGIADNLRKRLKVQVQKTTSGSSQETKLYITRGDIRVKVEVNHVFRGSVYPTVTSKLSRQAEEFFSRSTSILMLDSDELYASKLVAALDRQHPRDLFDVKLLQESGGITPRIRRAFTVYLAGHNRPMHELLPPRFQDISKAFDSEFAGMTTEKVTLEQLEETRVRLFRELPSSLDLAERSFLLSIKRLKPDWDILGIPGIEKLPAIRWKLLNLEKLAKNHNKYQKMLDALEERLAA
jgi:predicted nucleotidyltransferase component of viral defense system